MFFGIVMFDFVFGFEGKWILMEMCYSVEFVGVMVIDWVSVIIMYLSSVIYVYVVCLFSCEDVC